MTITAIGSRVGGGALQQHLHSETTAVAEKCVGPGYSCWWDSDCCNETVCLNCDFWTCAYC